MMRAGLLSFIGPALMVALGLAVLLSPLAAEAPDGLERTLEDLGVRDDAEPGGAGAVSLMPDYVVPGIRNEFVGTALAGLAGTLVAFVAGIVAAKLIARRASRAKKQEDIL